MIEITTERQLINTLKEKDYIVLDQAYKKWVVYNNRTAQGLYDEEEISVTRELHEKLEQWSDNRVISRNCFIPSNILMLITYGIWDKEEFDQLSSDVRFEAKQLGLIKPNE